MTVMVARKRTVADLVEKVVDAAQDAPDVRAERPPVFEGVAPHIWRGRKNTIFAEVLELGAALERSYAWNTADVPTLLSSLDYRALTHHDQERVAWMGRVLDAESLGLTRHDALIYAGKVPR